MICEDVGLIEIIVADKIPTKQELSPFRLAEVVFLLVFPQLMIYMEVALLALVKMIFLYKIPMDEKLTPFRPAVVVSLLVFLQLMICMAIFLLFPVAVNVADKTVHQLLIVCMAEFQHDQLVMLLEKSVIEWEMAQRN